MRPDASAAVNIGGSRYLSATRIASVVGVVGVVGASASSLRFAVPDAVPDVAADAGINRVVTIGVSVDVGMEVVVARETSTAEGETDGRSTWVSSGGVIRTR